MKIFAALAFALGLVLAPGDLAPTAGATSAIAEIVHDKVFGKSWE